MDITLETRVLAEGQAQGTLLKLNAPLCFWGGVDATTGVISSAKHPDVNTCISGQVVAIPMIIGSSSSSQLLLELLYNGIAPAAIILGEAEAIISMAAIVGREMGFGHIPIVQCDLEKLETGAYARIETNGALRASG